VAFLKMRTFSVLNGSFTISEQDISIHTVSGELTAIDTMFLVHFICYNHDTWFTVQHNVRFITVSYVCNIRKLHVFQLWHLEPPHTVDAT
jgi:hypothetical protein